MRKLRMRTSFGILLFAHDLSISKSDVQQELDALSLMASWQSTWTEHLFPHHTTPAPPCPPLICKSARSGLLSQLGCCQQQNRTILYQQLETRLRILLSLSHHDHQSHLSLQTLTQAKHTTGECSTADVKCVVLASQEANFLHCYNRVSDRNSYNV